MKLIFFVSLFIIGYLTGRQVELSHFRSLRDREERFRHIATITGQWKQHIDEGSEYKMVMGSVVIGADYFKSVVSGLRNVFGGKMNNYETLLDRGRREALVRMLAEADQWGAEKVLNVRFVCTDIGGKNGKSLMPCSEIHVYGTGIKKASNEVRS